MVISNATEPYSYQWWMEPIEWLPGYTVWASDYLDDTTSANPNMFGIFEDSLTLFLRVTDAIQQVCYDTIIVSASLFGTHLGTGYFSITAGDSVQLWGTNVGSNYPTDSILWQPTTGLHDPNAVLPWASPETSQNYSCIVWDSQGCMQQGSPFMFVEVLPVGIEEAEMQAGSVYATETHVVVNCQATTQLELINTEGKVVLTQQLPEGTSRIATNGLASGVYIYRLTGSATTPASGKLWVR